MLLILLPWQNNSLLHSFVFKRFDVQWYSNTVNLLIVGMASWTCMSIICWIRSLNTFDIESKKHHTFQAVCLVKKMVNQGFLVHLCVERFREWGQISCSFQHQNQPTVLQYHLLSLQTLTWCTSTTVSTVQTTIFLWPCLAISFTHKNTLVSASSWLHGLKLDRSKSPLLLMQVSLYGHTSGSYFLPSDITVLDKKWDNSVLFWSSRRKPFQFVGVTEFSCTFLRTPFPLFTRVVLFKLCRYQILHPLYQQHTNLDACEFEDKTFQKNNP